MKNNNKSKQVVNQIEFEIRQYQQILSKSNDIAIQRELIYLINQLICEMNKYV